MKKFLPILLIIVILISSAFAPITEEDEPEIELKLRRDFGFGGIGQIQGTFTISANTPDDVIRVEFLLDGELMAEDIDPPFKFQFNTDSYEPGQHTFSAVGYTSDGSNYSSNTKTTEFLSGDDAMGQTLSLVVPLLLVFVGIVALTAIVPILTGKKKTFEVGKYGLAGGAVCNRCELPFSRNVLSPNLVIGKLERCPHCGKWMIAPKAGEASLKAAEDIYLADAKQGNLEISKIEDDEDKLRQMLDDSRFDD